MRHPLPSHPSQRVALVALAVSIAIAGFAGGGAASPVTWTTASSASPGSLINELSGVAMTADHGWAVGNQVGPGTDSKVLIERYSRVTNSWAVMHIPKPGGNTSQLESVTGGDANAWAVGGTTDKGDSFALAEHWNGSTWRPTSLPKVTSGFLQSVTMRSAHDVWAVGSYRAHNNSLVPWTVHWNGKRWSTIPAVRVNGVFASAQVTPNGHDVFAVGYAGYIGRGTGRAFAERWNGKHWRRLHVPKVAGGVDFFYGVTAVSATNAWAVGRSQAPDSQIEHTLVMHWNGKHWKRIAAPDPRDGELNGIAAAGPKSVWAVGAAEPSNFTQVALILHWNGGHWTRQNAAVVKGACQTHDAQSLLGAAIVPGTPRAWAVGDIDRSSCGGNGDTIAERSF